MKTEVYINSLQALCKKCGSDDFDVVKVNRDSLEDDILSVKCKKCDTRLEYDNADVVAWMEV